MSLKLKLSKEHQVKKKKNPTENSDDRFDSGSLLNQCQVPVLKKC